MDKVIAEEIAKVDRLKKSSTPWQPDQPWPQRYYEYVNDRWTVVGTPESTAGRFEEVALYSWNIDFMLPFPASRMLKAVQCLKQIIEQQSPAIANVIFLQESTRSDLELLANDVWIKQTFMLSDLDTSNWTSGHYGTITLVDKRLQIKSSFRCHYSQTVMERDAFFTDICLSEDKVIRLCNSHLESLALEPPRRPHQVKLCAQYMQQDGIYGAAMSGDFNAIQDFDRTLHSDNGLNDAYLQQGGVEDVDDGYTWGQQAATQQREKFGCSRMDKVFFCGGIELLSFKTFGAGIEVEDEFEREQLIGLGFDKPWITDHLGVMAHFSLKREADSKSSL